MSGYLQKRTQTPEGVGSFCNISILKKGSCTPSVSLFFLINDPIESMESPTFRPAATVAHVQFTIASVMMYAKASSDDTAKHKKCINNAKIMQNQSRKKCTENAKTSHQRMPWNAKKSKKNAKKTHLSTKPMQKTHKKCKKHAQKRHKKCKNNAQKMQKNAIKKQNECDQKRSGLCLCIFFALYLRFFGDFFLHFLCVSLRKRKKKIAKKGTKNAQKNAKNMQNNRTKNAKKSKKIAQKRWCVKFGRACAFFLLFLNCCSAFFFAFFLASCCMFLLFDMHSF